MSEFSGRIDYNQHQVQKKFNVYEDNVIIFEKLLSGNGSFYTFDLRPYLEQLKLYDCEFYFKLDDITMLTKL